MAIAGKGGVCSAPGRSISSGDVVEQTPHVAEAEGLRNTRGGIAGGGDHRWQEAGPAGLHGIEAAQQSQRDDGFGIRVLVAVNGLSIGVVADHPKDRHTDLIHQEGEIVAGNAEGFHGAAEVALLVKSEM